MTSEFYIRSVAAPGQFSFSLSQKMPPVQLFQFIGGIVRAEPAIDEAARDAPIPAVFVDHAVHDAIDFCLHAYPPKNALPSVPPGCSAPGRLLLPVCYQASTLVSSNEANCCVSSVTAVYFHVESGVRSLILSMAVPIWLPS